MDAEALRADVPALADVTYLNYGAHGPSPRSVVAACDRGVADHEFRAGTRDPYVHAGELFDTTRAAIAELIGCVPAEIALTQSTGDGIARIAGAFEWGPDDVVVLTDLEHAAGRLPWYRLRDQGVTVREVPSSDGRIDRAAFARAVRDATLVCFSAMTWTHGTMLPVAELVETARDAGAFTLIDAVQVPGHRPMDVRAWGADAVAAAGHKWLLGPWGAGFLYVREDVVESLHPRAVGYGSVVEADATEPQLHPDARRFEVGSMGIGPYAGLAEAIELIRSVGIDRIEARIERLTDRLKGQLPADRLRSPDAFESGLVAVTVPDPPAVVDQLAAADVVIRALPGGEAVRISVHAVSTADEIDRVAEGLERHAWG